mgnify:CR=1 FL=1|jgi:type I restriction enzyme S subunit
MSEWKTYRLGDIIQLKSGGTPDKSNPDYWGGSIPWISAKSMYDDFISTSDLFITEEGLQAGSKIAKKDSILLLTRGSGLFNRIPVCYVVSDVAYNQDVKNIVLKQENVTSIKFLYYWLYGNKELLSSMLETTGIGAGKIDTKRFLNLSISLPSQKEQARYIHLMDLLFDKIELNRRINANLEAQAQALFRSWFVDFEPFRDGPFVDSELGKIPQGWKVETLSNLATVIKKGITPSNSETYSHYSIPAYDDAHFPEKQSGETIKSGKYIVYNNSILLSKLNPRIKRLWFIKTAEENAICSTEFIPIQTKDTELISFVFYLIDSDIFYQQALSLVNGATGSHQRFHAEDIMQIPFAWNKDAAIDFAQKANYILQKIEDNIRENQTLSALRDTMLPKLMAGEINVE